MKRKTNGMIKKILITSSAVVFSIVAALLLAGYIMRGMTAVWESGEENNGQKWKSASAEEANRPEQGELSESRAQSGQSRLDTSYHPLESQSDRNDSSNPDPLRANEVLEEQQPDEDGAQESQDNASDEPDLQGSQSDSNQASQDSLRNGQDEEAKEIADFIQNMTLEEKIAQLFVLTPEALTGVQRVVRAGDTTKKAVNDYPVGGLVYFRQNIDSEKQFVKMVKNIQTYGRERIGLPFFICVDEEGGSVTRISGRGFPNVPEITDMYAIGEQGDGAAAYDVGKQIGKYLARFQVNVDFAPVADVFSNEKNRVIGKRAFGKDPDLAAKMAANEVYGLKSQKVAATLKHFPGHGDTEEDSHSGRAHSYKTLDQLRDCELIPFRAGIEAGADFVMAGHISLPNILDDETPASLSYEIITELLRGELEFDGIVITDALNMDAITEHYDSAQAAVQAVLAGVDMLLMPEDFKAAYDGLLQAIREGAIQESRIDQSLERILKVKKTFS